VLIQAVRFGMVGVINTLAALSIIYLLMFWLFVDPVPANAVGYAVGVAISFSLNRKWTFGDTDDLKRTLPRYILVLIVAYIANLCVLIFCLTALNTNSYLSQPIGMAVYTVVNFLGSRYYTFGRRNGLSPLCGGA